MKQRVPLVSVALFAVAMLHRRELATRARCGRHQVRDLDALSGPAAPWGIPHKHATELVFDEVNSQGASRSAARNTGLEVIAVRPQVRDRRGRRHRQPAHRQGRREVRLDPRRAPSPRRTRKPVNESGVLGLTLAYAEGLVSPKNPLTFQCFPAPPETTTFWKWIKSNQPAIKRVASIAPNDDTGWWSVKVETAYVQKLGYEVVAKEFFERTMTDFNPDPAADARPEAGRDQRRGSRRRAASA